MARRRKQCVDVERREPRAALQREPAPGAGGQAIGVRAEQRAGEAQNMVTADRGERRRGGVLETAPRAAPRGAPGPALPRS